MSVSSPNVASELMARHNHGIDGTLDRILRLSPKQKSTPAIFVHAGAGFHSHQNEHVHLEACVSAVTMGMKFLKAGATATEAVEAALRILEDREITNAGYGSNLSIDGTVECDATIVDHLGRSGACGAVPNIRNPISLAKLILDASSRPLSLRRVPPNALVGDGARKFAEEHGMATCANEYLISRNSRDRFFRWQDDLLQAEERLQDIRQDPSPSSMTAMSIPSQYGTPLSPSIQVPREHRAAIMACTWNEGQPDTPASEMGSLQDVPLFASRVSVTPVFPMSNAPRTPVPRPLSGPATVAGARTNGSSTSRGQHPCRPVESRANKEKDYDEIRQDTSDSRISISTPFHDGASPKKRRAENQETFEKPVDASPMSVDSHSTKRRPYAGSSSQQPSPLVSRDHALSYSRDDDMITDTIGAIAIDDQGRIAAGSSSGGIGMKHRGRLGPAALVGIGTSVVPCADDDEQGTTVAAVTSGTGEHMATTMASQRCAERIYQGTRRGPGGVDLPDDDDDAVLESFVAQDFMNHPSVKGSDSQGAIGVMVVKKCRTGYYLYFAHNTDSFALASMGALDGKPVCTMSRLPAGAQIAKGGCKIRIA